jgi:hypothetical protein
VFRAVARRCAHGDCRHFVRHEGSGRILTARELAINIGPLWPEMFIVRRMKRALLLSIAAAALCLPCAAEPREASTRLDCVKSRLRIEGTSNIDTWQVESKSVTGFFEPRNELPLRHDLQLHPGPVEARGNLALDVRTLKSVEKDGKPFSNKMDEIMYEALRAARHPKIEFQLDRLGIKAFPHDATEPLDADAAGQLTVGGMTREVNIPLRLMALPGGQVRISGATAVKMTDFRISPPSPTITLGLIKTGDEVKLSFELVLERHR